MITITKKFSFCYGHFLPNHEGKCQNRHGHNSELEVEIAGSQEKEGPGEGMILDFSRLKSIVDDKVISVLDHQFLNEVLPEQYLPPTAENITYWIAKVLDGYFQRYCPDVSVIRVRVTETPTSWAEWRLDR